MNIFEKIFAIYCLHPTAKETMHNYYFVAASLPPLVLGEPPDITFEELEYRLSVNLSKDDLKKVAILRRYIDLCNLRYILLEKPIDPKGNLTEKELDEALLVKDFLPEYVLDFFDAYETKELRIQYFHRLISNYFSKEVVGQSGFLKEYLTFERELRLVLLAIRAKKLDRDPARELQFEDFADPLVAQILAQKDAKDFDPPPEYRDIKEKLHSCGDDPWQQMRTVEEYRFNKIEILSGYPLFSLDWILGYVARLLIVEQWNLLNFEEGKSKLQTFKTG